MATVTMKDAVGSEAWIGSDEVRRRVGWGSGRIMRLALLEQVRHRVLPGGRLVFSAEDVDRVEMESK